MPALEQSAISMLDFVTSVDMKTVAKTNLFTCPTGKVAYIYAVLISDPSASLAGGTDYDFGTGANADTWMNTVDLSSMTTLDTDFMFVTSDGATKFERMVAGDVFGIKPITGSTGAATATVWVFGFMADA
jgi:hypothetical protein